MRLSEDYDTGEKDSGGNKIYATHEWDVSLKKVEVSENLDYYLLIGFEPSMDKLEDQESFYILVHDKAAGSMSFLILEDAPNEQEATEQSQDKFDQDRLIIDDGSRVHTNKLNNGNTYYEAQFDPAARDRHQSSPVKNLNNLKINADKIFTIENFLGSGQDVTWKADYADNEKLWIGDTSFAVKSIPGLGYVIDPEIQVDAQYQDFVDRIKNIVWSADVSSTQLDEVKTTGGISVKSNAGSVKDAPKDSFYFTEFNYYRQNDNGTQTQMYKVKWYDMYGYDLSISYVEMKPASATLSTEYHESGTSYELQDGTTVYVGSDGKYYAKYDEVTGQLSEELGLEEELKTEIRYKFLDASGKPLSFNGAELWSYMTTTADLQYYGKDCYLIDSHPEYNLYVVNDALGSYKIVMRSMSGVTQVQPVDGNISFEQKGFTIKVDDQTTVNLTITLVEGQDSYEVINGDNTYTFTRSQGSDGNVTWKYTVKDKEGKVSEATDITPDATDPEAVTTTMQKLQILQYNGSTGKDEWKDYLIDNQQVYIDLLDTPAVNEKVYDLYTLSGITFSPINGVNVIYRNGIYQLNDSSQNYELAKDGDTTLTATNQEQETYSEPTGRTLLKYVDKDGYLVDKSGNTINFDDMEMSNYKTNTDLSSGKLILRPGGAEGADDSGDVGSSGSSSSLNSGKSVLLIIGPLSNIDIREVAIPTNALGISQGYVISDTMYLTRSGLVVNISGDFSAKFDGETYTSTRVVATELGDLGEKRDLVYNEEGKVMYGGVEYTLYNNSLSYVDENGAITQCSPELTLEILYSELPEDNSDGPKVTFLKDQSIYLERLTDVIAKDFTGSYYYNTGNEGDKVWRKASFTPAGGIKDYSSYKDGQVVQERKYQLVGTVSYDGTAYLTISQNGDEIYYELVQHGLVTGSDGSVFSTDPDAQFSQSLVKDEQENILYHIGYVEAQGEGKDIIIRLENVKGTIVDGDALLQQLDPDIYTQDDIDLITNNGNVIIYSNSSGTIGAPGDPLEISTGTGRLIFRNFDGQEVLSTDTYISSDEDVTLHPDTVVDGIILDVDAGGSIYGGKITVINDGTADLDAGKNIEFTEEVISDNGTVDMDAGESIKTGDVSGTNGSDVIMDAVAGDITTGNVDFTDSELDMNAGGSIDTGKVSGTDGSNVTMGAGEDITTEEIVAEGSILDMDAGGSISSDSLDADNSEVYKDAGKDIIINEVDADDGSSIEYRADGDIRFKRISSDDGSGAIFLDAKGVVGRLLPDGEDAVIFINETNTSAVAPDAESSLTVSGDVSIGEADSPLVVDIPESLTMEIPRAGDIWIEAKDLDYVPPRQAGGRDEEGERIEGDLIDELDDEDNKFSTALEAQTPEELAEYFLSSVENTDSDLSRKQLEELVTGVFSEEKIRQLLGKTVEPESWTQEQFMKLLTEALKEKDRQDQPLVDDDTLIKLYWDAMSDEEKRALIADDGSFWENVDYPEPVEDTRDFRDFTAHIGQSKGETSLSNNGSITVTQDKGTLTAKDIVSVYEDVSLTAPYIKGVSGDEANVTGSVIELTATAPDGSILDLTTDQQDWIEHTVANLDGVERDPVSGEYVIPDDMPTDGGSWTISRNAQTGELEISFMVDFTSISVRDNSVSTSLTATAPGDIQITEIYGDMGVDKVISANNGDISLSVPEGDLVDSNPAADGLNISTGGDVKLDVPEGSIGSDEDPVDVEIGGTLTTNSQSDTFITTGEDLTMVGDSLEGELNVQADKDLELSNTNGDLKASELDVGGDLKVTSPDGSTNIDKLHVGGILTMDSQGDITVDKTTGDVTVDKITAQGDILLNLDSKLSDTDTGDAIKELAQAKADKAQAQAELDALKQRLETERDYLQPLEDSIDRLREQQAELEAEKSELEKQTPADEEERLEIEKRLEAIEAELQDIPGQIQELEDKYQPEKGLEDQLLKDKEEAEKKVEAAQQKLEEAREKAENSKASITAGGDLDINMENGGAVGENGNSLSIDVGGTTSIDSGDGKELEGIYIESYGEDALNTDPMTADEIRIDSLGSIDPTNDDGKPSFTAEDLTLNSIDGDTGTKEKPIYTYADTIGAMGNNVNIINLKDTKIDQIIADDEVNIQSEGDITDANPQDDDNNIISGSTDLTADGDIGSKDEPIKIQTDEFSGEGENVYIDSDGDIVIDHIGAEEDVVITTDGSVTDKPENDGKPAIDSENLEIDAGGTVGRPDNPLDINVPGEVDVTSRLDLVFLRRHGPSHPAVTWPGKVNHPAYLFADENGRIRPDDPLTRGEAARMIYILLGMPMSQSGDNPFQDLDEDDPLYQAILSLYYMGAFEGWGLDNLFDGDREITRAEFISLLVWFYCRMGGELQTLPELDIADMDESHWAYQAVQTALNLGWIELDEDGSFRPEDIITRGEAAAAANKAASREPNPDTLEPLDPGFTDLPEDHPFYEDILEAAVSHVEYPVSSVA